jgi:biotin carboxylase
MSIDYVLIIGGGKDTLFLLQQVKLLGYKTLVVDKDPLAPAVEMADEFLCLSAWDSGPILAEIKVKKIIACLTRSSGLAVLCWAEINKSLGFPSPSSKNVLELSGKLSLHTFCLGLNISSPITQTYKGWKNEKNIKLPLVFKPEWEKEGKSGVVLVKHAENIKDAVAHAEKYLAKGSVLVQEYLNGKDLTILGVCLNDSYFPYALLEEKNSFNDSEYVSHTGFNEISNNPAAVGMIEVATLICKEQKLVFSPFNLSFRIVENTPYLMECNLDFGGEGVLESLLRKDKTCNIIANYLQSFLNISKNEDFKECMGVWHDRSSKFSIDTA